MEATEAQAPPAPPPLPGDEPWGIAEIARHHHVQRATVDHWRSQKNHAKLPEPDGYTSGRPWWWKSTVTVGAGAARRREDAFAWAASLVLDRFSPPADGSFEDTAARIITRGTVECAATSADGREVRFDYEFGQDDIPELAARARRLEAEAAAWPGRPGDSENGEAR
jgi:hypothetical protein